MKITFYRNNSESNRVDKDLTALLTIDNGSLTNEGNIESPMIELPTNQVIIESNYCFIEDFGRFYFLNPPTINNNVVTVITGHVDVLMTYRDKLRNLSAVIARNEYAYNLYQPDNQLPLYSNKTVQFKRFSRVIDQSPSYVLITAG